MSDQPSITCPQCGRTSYNPNDVEHRYCGYCHQWHKDIEFDPHTVAREAVRRTTGLWVVILVAELLLAFIFLLQGHPIATIGPFLAAIVMLWWRFKFRHLWARRNG